jgi:hypothetical protein
MFAARSPAEL